MANGWHFQVWYLKKENKIGKQKCRWKYKIFHMLYSQVLQQDQTGRTVWGILNGICKNVGIVKACKPKKKKQDKSANIKKHDWKTKETNVRGRKKINYLSMNNVTMAIVQDVVGITCSASGKFTLPFKIFTFCCLRAWNYITLNQTFSTFIYTL